MERMEVFEMFEDRLRNEFSKEFSFRKFEYHFNCRGYFMSVETSQDYFDEDLFNIFNNSVNARFEVLSGFLAGRINLSKKDIVYKSVKKEKIENSLLIVEMFLIEIMEIKKTFFYTGKMNYKRLEQIADEIVSIFDEHNKIFESYRRKLKLELKNCDKPKKVGESMSDLYG